MQRNPWILSGILSLSLLFAGAPIAVAQDSSSSSEEIEEAALDQVKKKGKKRLKKSARKGRRKKLRKAEGKTKTALQKEKEKKKGFFSFSTGLGYSISSDFNDDIEPRIYNHSISVSPSIGFGNYFSLDFGANIFYQSLVRDVAGDSADISVDLSVGASKSFKLGKAIGGEHKLGVSGGASIPTSDESRFEGINAYYSGGVSLRSKFAWYSLSNRIGGSFIHHTFDQSPSTGVTNQDYSIRYSMGHSIRFWKYFSASLGLSVKRSHRIDGISTVSFSNSQSISAGYKGFSASLSHSNGGHTDKDQFTFWYIDRTRQVIALSMGYSF